MTSAGTMTITLAGTARVEAAAGLRLSLSGLDVVLIVIYFAFVLGIGFALRRLTQQDNLATAYGNMVQGLIQTYQALGGGWQIRLNNAGRPTEETPPAPPNQTPDINPRELPTNLKQVVGHPMIVSESTWVSPLAYQSEGPFLTAAYQSLTGVDSYYWFSTGSVA